MHFNVRSIVKNKHILEELHELDNFPDIIATSETRLNNHNINTCLLSLIVIIQTTVASAIAKTTTVSKNLISAA